MARFRPIREYHGAFDSKTQRALDAIWEWSKQFPQGFLDSNVFNTYVTNLINNISSPRPMLLEWGAGDLGNTTNERFLHAIPIANAAPFGGGSRENEGRGQRYMLLPGTFSTMLACVRGVQPNSLDHVWTYNLRVNELDTVLTDSYDIMDAGNQPEFRVTTGLSVHVDQGDRVGIKSVLSRALATVSAPYVAVLFTPDPL